MKLYKLICILIYKTVSDGTQKYLDIKGHGPVLDVVNIVVDPLSDGGIASVAVDLRPSGDARTNLVLYHVPGDLLPELLNKLRSLGSWAHKAHLAKKHVEKLRHLVDTELSQNAADAGNSGIVSGGPALLFLFLGLHLHGPELVHHERRAV